MANRKRRGESGQPCLTPAVIVNPSPRQASIVRRHMGKRHDLIVAFGKRPGCESFSVAALPWLHAVLEALSGRRVGTVLMLTRVARCKAQREAAVRQRQSHEARVPLHQGFGRMAEERSRGRELERRRAGRG